MAEVRIIGDRIFEARSSRLVPMQPPRARAAEASGSSAGERRRLETVDGHVVHPADYRCTWPAYESAAREIHKLPVVRVWEIVHSSLRGACTHESVTPPRYVILLNSYQCVVHRLATFEHELEHVRRGFPTTRGALGPKLQVALEALSNAAADKEARSAAAVAAMRISESGSSVQVDPERCRTCSHNSEAPCPQGGEVFEAVKRALAGM